MLSSSAVSIARLHRWRVAGASTAAFHPSWRPSATPRRSRRRTERTPASSRRRKEALPRCARPARASSRALGDRRVDVPQGGVPRGASLPADGLRWAWSRGSLSPSRNSPLYPPPIRRRAERVHAGAFGDRHPPVLGAPAPSPAVDTAPRAHDGVHDADAFHVRRSDGRTAFEHLPRPSNDRPPAFHRPSTGLPPAFDQPSTDLPLTYHRPFTDLPQTFHRPPTFHRPSLTFHRPSTGLPRPSTGLPLTYHRPSTAFH